MPARQATATSGQSTGHSRAAVLRSRIVPRGRDARPRCGGARGRVRRHCRRRGSRRALRCTRVRTTRHRPQHRAPRRGGYAVSLRHDRAGHRGRARRRRARCARAGRPCCTHLHCEGTCRPGPPTSSYSVARRDLGAASRRTDARPADRGASPSPHAVEHGQCLRHRQWNCRGAGDSRASRRRPAPGVRASGDAHRANRPGAADDHDQRSSHSQQSMPCSLRRQRLSTSAAPRR